MFSVKELFQVIPDVKQKALSLGPACYDVSWFLAAVTSVACTSHHKERRWSISSRPKGSRWTWPETSTSTS